MPSASEIVALVQADDQRATRLANQGNFREAEACYRHALSLMPDHAGLHHNLGSVLQQQWKIEEAAACYRRAVELMPGYAKAYCSLGTVLDRQGELDEAIAMYRHAVELAPDFAEAHSNLGLALHGQGHFDEAAKSYRRAIELAPDLFEAHYNLANVLKEQGKQSDAVPYYRRTLAIKPDFAKALDNLGACLQQLGQLDEAITCHRRALELEPTDPETHDNLGVALQEQEKWSEAEACHRQALRLNPDLAQAHYNLGVALDEQLQLDEAAAAYQRAVELNPKHVEAHYNLGVIYQEQRKLAEAEACYRRAIELRSDYADAHWNLSNVLLLQGDFDRGWPEFKWRWQLGQIAPREFNEPHWTGQDVAGKTVLIHAEQGLGDTLQFVRYVPLVKERGATVIFQCHKPLLNLLAGFRGVDRLLPLFSELPPLDYHSPLMSLPGVFKTTLDTIPASVPYLFADPELTAEWKTRLAGIGGFRIGINWQGREGKGLFVHRDIPIDCFTSVAQLPNVTLVSLQKSAQRKELPEPILDLGPIDQAHGAFMDTAAIMMNLDLVITSDTSIAHLAGALGVPVWVALPLSADWRWMVTRSDSPWYPTMRLFRQLTEGEWTAVFADMKGALRSLIGASGSPPIS
jgi:tetratricopeptide (TPR) repeat protein